MTGFGNPQTKKKKGKAAKKELHGQELHQKALLSHSNGDLREAEKLYREAIRIGYFNHGIFSNLGVICKNSGRPEEAITLYREAIKINPSHQEAYINLSNLYQALGMHELMLKCTLKLLDINPTNTDTLINLGSIYKERRNLSLALAYTIRAFKIDPNNYIALMNLGGLYKTLGKLDLALAYTSKSLEINPNNSIAHMNMGGIYKDLGNLPLALASTNKSLEIEPNNPDTQINAGEIYQDMGDGEKALIFFRKALENTKTKEEAASRIATIYYYNKQYGEGIKALEGTDSKKGKSILLSLYLCANNKSKFNACAKEINTKKWHTQQSVAAIDHAKAIYNQDIDNGLSGSTLDSVINWNISEDEFSNAFLEEIIIYLTRTKINSRMQGHLINGKQTSGNILDIPSDPFIELKQLLTKKIEEYNKICAIGTDNEFISNWNQNRYQLNGWAIIMEQGGSLTSHNHESGWLTGTFYLQMPDVVKSREEGAIEFSHEGPNYPKGNTEFTSKILCPKARDLNIFSSSLFHRTIPFLSIKKRICIAFDIRECN